MCTIIKLNITIIAALTRRIASHPLLLLVIINYISSHSYFAGSLTRETWTFCGCPGGETGHSSCRIDWTDRLDGAVTSFLTHFQDPLETPPDYTIEPLMLRPPYTDRLPGTFDCTKSGRRIRRACWSILWDPSRSANTSNRIGRLPDLNTNNPFRLRVGLCGLLSTGW